MVFGKRDLAGLNGIGLSRPSKDSELSKASPSNTLNANHPNTSQLNVGGSRQQELPPPLAQSKPLTQGHGHAMISALKGSMMILYKGGKLFPHLQSAVEALLEALESVKADGYELRAMAFDLHEWAMTLSDYLSNSQPEQMDIHEQAKRLRDAQQSSKVKQLVGSEHELEVIEHCYRRIEAAFRHLQMDAALITWKTVDDHLKESRLNGLRPAHDARYDSSFSTEVERGECLANTRVSVLKGIWIWIRGEINAKIHWTNGMAGTGKTTIAYSVCVGLDEEKRLGASFFCSRVSLECRDVSRVLPTIAYQLAQQFYPFRSTLCRILGEHPSIAQRNIPVQFEYLIRAPLLEVKHLLPNGLIIVIDALDECSNPRAVDVMLNVLFRHVADLPVRFFLTSRPEPSISNTMLAQEDQSRSILHLHNVEEQFVKADIETYLTVRLAKLNLNSDQIQQLADQAGILFIYAATVTRYLERGFGALVSTRLQAILTRDPEGTRKMDKEIDRLYKTILDGALSDEDLERSEMELIKRVLWTVVCIKEPVTKRTLAILLEKDYKIILGALQPLQSVLHVSESNEVVSTLHASFPEFLLNARRSGAALFCDEQMQNKYLAGRCFELMKQQLRFNICRLSTSFRFDRDVSDLGDRLKAYIPAELAYACRYWVEHLRILPPHAELLDYLDNFLRVELLFWMEVLNLYGWIINAPKILAEIYTWLEQSNGPSSMRKLVHDARSFVAAFAANPICQSTPHIYISALPLVPKQSSVWKNYQQITQGLVQVNGTLADQRDRLAVWEAHCKLSAIAYSPDGSRIAIGTEDGEVHIWDAHTGTPFGSPFQTHAKAIRCVAFSPDGAFVASGSADFTLRVSHTRSGILVGIPHKGHTGEIRTVAFSQDGALLASGSVDRTVRVWEVHSNASTSKLLEGHTEDVSCVVFSPNSKFIASGSYDHKIRIWSATDGEPFGSPLRGHTDYVNCVTFSPDGSHVASGSCDGTVRLWNFSTCTSIGRPFHHQVCVVQSVAFTPDGARILSGLLDPRIEVWDISSRTLVSSSSHLSNESDCHVVFSTDGTRMAAGSVGGTIQIWAVGIDTSNLASIPLHFHTKNIQSAALSADCTLVASGSGPQAYAILVWDLRTGALVNGPFTGHTNDITALEFSPDGSRIASGSQDCTVRVWDVCNGTPIGNPLEGHPTTIDHIVFSPNGAYIASIGSNDLVIRLWDVCYSTLVDSLQGHTDSISSVAFSPNGTRIVSGSADRTIRVWNLRDGFPYTTWFILYSSAITSVSFSPDGAHIVSGSSDGKVQVLDVQTGALVGRPTVNYSERVKSVGFYGGRIASAVSSGTVYPSDPSTIKSHLGKVLCRKFSPDGNHIITASTFDDGQLQVLSAPSNPHLGILARRSVIKSHSVSLHTSATLLRIGGRTTSPRTRQAGKPKPGEPPIKRAPPLAKPVEKPSLARVHAALLRDVDWWSSRSAFTNVTILGIPRLLARDWLELFPSVVREELNTLNLERLATSSHPEWDLDAIANDIQDDRHFGISRAFMLRFLNFAISRLTSMNSSSHSELLRSLHAIKDATDLRHMTEWYPLARSMRRKIIMHVGPTNSGKTYNALQALASAPSGVYAGPLRLLAHEVWQRINKGSIAPKQQDVEIRTEGIVDLDDATPVSVTTERSDSSSPSTPTQTPPQVQVTGYAGRACNLLTGEEQRVVSPNATAVSCTVEMIPKHLIWDVGVIDEIQMLADPHRGGAWTSAVLGLAARELHLCGEDTVVDLVRALCATTGDELIVNRYERLTPLEVAQNSLSGRLKNVERGDCVVTFSRNEIFLTKRKIEDATGLRCAVVYGRLPPEVRSEQAQLFNDEESGYDVIVASDSVGMGLNLKIKRVVFLRTDKWNGKEDVPLPIPLIKQIAGRAGRFGLLKSKGKFTGDDSKPKSVAEIVASQPPGVVTALRNDSLNRVRTALSLPNPKVQHARVDIANPNTEILSQALPPETNVSDLLETMRLLARLPEHTKLGQPNIELRNNLPSASSAKSLNFDSQRPDDISLDVDLITRHLPLSERLVFASAPVRWRDATARQAAMSFIRAYERKMHVSIRGELKELGMIEALDDIRKQMSSRTQKKSRKHGKADDGSEEPEKKLQIKLQMLESLHSTLVLYMWLSYRLPLGFYQASEAQGMKNETERGIEWCLEQIRSMKQKRTATNWEELEEEEEEEKPKDQRIQYLNRDALEKWRREGMSPAVWDDLLEKARRETS